MLQELLSLNVFAFFLIFTRISAGVLSFPGFSAGWVPARVRLLLAIIISFMMTPVLMSDLPMMPRGAVGLVLLISGEIIIGVYIGTIARAALAALQVAGTVIALVSSMANAMIQDAVSQQQSSIIAGMLSTMGLVIIFVTDMHHLMLQALFNTYVLFPPGEPLEIADMADFLSHQVSESFNLGLQLAAPLVITAMIYYIALGLLGRLMPALQVFFFGMPLQIAAQFIVLMITLSGILMVFAQHFEDSLIGFLIR